MSLLKVGTGQQDRTFDPTKGLTTESAVKAKLTVEKSAANAAGREAARDKNETRKYAQDVKSFSDGELERDIKNLSTEERRTINSTNTINRKEAAIFQLAKRYSGKSIRQLIVEKCLEEIAKGDQREK